MNDSFGPWATAMDSSSVIPLSAFWKSRMGRLPAISQQPAPRSWSKVLSLLGLLVVTCLVPTFHGAVAPQTADAAGPNKKQVGRIYLDGFLRLAGDGTEEGRIISGTFSIDPATGDWKHLMDYGFAPRVSPDGETLIFQHKEQVWNCDAKEAASPGRIADLSGKTSWMADGKHIVVSTGRYDEEDRQKGWKVETVKVTADGLIRSSLPIPETDFVEDCSPNGEWVVTSSDRHPPRGSGYQLYVMRMDGSEQHRVTKSGLNVYARFSPDSKKIAYVHQDKQGNTLRVVDLDGSSDRALSIENGFLNAAGGPAWSPNGKKLAVVKFDWQTNPKTGKRRLGNPADANYRLEIMDSDGGNPRVLELKGVEQVVGLGHPDWR